MNDIRNDVENGVKDALQYYYSSFDEFLKELQVTINDAFKYYDEFNGRDVPFKIKDNGHTMIVSVLDAEYEFDKITLTIVDSNGNIKQYEDW